ncbi:MAG: hypothetical protein WBS24_14785 [Terriglobales bacterium]
MTGVVIFNVATIALAVAVGAGLVPAGRLSSMLEWLHAIIGITPPAPSQTRIYAAVWVATIIILVDGFLFLLVFLTTHVM